MEGGKSKGIDAEQFSIQEALTLARDHVREEIERIELMEEMEE